MLMSSSVKQTSIGEASYSKLLSQISDPPKKLYCRGDLNLLNSQCFAVVGTRKLTSYGKEATRKITTGLVQTGFVIVSGLAMGIDATAHQATLDARGKTIAVLGSGIDDASMYPQIHIRLAKDILTNGGLIISEYEEGFNATQWSFPARNRIISGLSCGVLVVEADVKSGALITASCALDQNRDVFAVPGDILSPKSVGPNTLIQKGAKLVMTAHDIISEYQENLKLLPRETLNSAARNDTEEAILNLLDQSGVLSLDEIIGKSGIEASAVMVSTSMLEIHGIVKHLGNGKYIKI